MQISLETTFLQQAAAFQERFGFHSASINGKCDWANISILNKNGYYVGPGERDSFGWLTGIISTQKGGIVYG